MSSTSSVNSPALAPWREYLKRLHPAEAAIMVWDMKKWGIDLEKGRFNI